MELAPGETKTLTFELPVAELAFWNIDMEYVVGCSGTVTGLEVLPPEELTRTSYYNKFWKEAQHPAGLPSISCLSYN